jgi:hypothetical protein
MRYICVVLSFKNSKTITIIEEIESGIREAEENLTLYEETNFGSRADAIDFIDFHIIDRIEGLLKNARHENDLDVLLKRAVKIKDVLEKINTNLFRQLREKILTGSYTRASFTKMVSKYLGYDVSDIRQDEKIGYDNLDLFINGLFATRSIPDPIIRLEPEMIFYQKAPARIIFELAERAQFRKDDIFFDLGSGLGQVAILVNLVSGAITRGIEYEPAYCAYAKASALQLHLSGVDFINADARKADCSSGTIFFMYDPFQGSMLQDMLKILQRESRKRTIRIFTYGRCSQDLARLSWLHCVNGEGNDSHHLYEFRK